MAQTLEQLSRQSNTLKSINGIVRTMKTLSAINALPYEQAVNAMAAYQQTLEKGFAAFAFATQGRYAQAAEVAAKTNLLVVFGSDHGLCGSYNEHLAEQVAQFCQQHNPQGLELICVGGKMQRSLMDRGLQPSLLLMPPAAVTGVNRLASELVQRIELSSRSTGLTGLNVRLAFTQRRQHQQQEPLIAPLLPLPKSLFVPLSHWPAPALPMLNQKPEQVLLALVRNYLFVGLYRASAEAMATENAARLALMQQAEQAVAERLQAVQQDMTQVRQDEITTELMDIIIGHLDER